MARNRKRGRSTSPTYSARNVRTKESAFAERYDTANKTNEQVLSKPSNFVSITSTSTNLQNSSIRGTNQELDVVMLYSFQDTYHCWGEGRS
jgi:hypothetical protein